MGITPNDVDQTGAHEFMAAVDGFAASKGAGKKNAPIMATETLARMGIEGF